MRVGVKNLIDIKDCGLECGFPKSAYGVVSQRIRLNPDHRGWFSNAYLTAGVGNGEFRPLDEQVKASIASQRDAGCQTYGYVPDQPCSPNTLRRAVLDAANYGELTPIGAAAIEVYPASPPSANGVVATSMLALVCDHLKTLDWSSRACGTTSCTIAITVATSMFLTMKAPFHCRTT